MNTSSLFNKKHRLNVICKKNGVCAGKECTQLTFQPPKNKKTKPIRKPLVRFSVFVMFFFSFFSFLFQYRRLEQKRPTKHTWAFSERRAPVFAAG